ncbi:MAG: hypothetical protein JSS00_07855 [Proteobacteria bacterium]|nr:hypothetical protein [Pseudomonadota bacterium]
MSINVVDEFADLSDLMSAPMEDLRARYRALHLQLNFHVLRRSGWLCRSAQAWRIVEEWLRDRHSRDGQGTEVFLASDWPELLELFSRDELASAANGEGFVELARIAIARSG